LKAGGWAFFGLHVCLVVTLFLMVLALFAALYLMNALKALFPQIKFRPGFVHLTILYFSFLLTEIFFMQMAYWRDADFDTKDPAWWAFPMYFSPVHASGRLTGALLRVTSLDAAVAGFPLIAVTVIVMGYLLSRKMRSDIFIRG
ncbi:MAG: hypothetical protein L0Z54_05410, partial [Thermoplasmata archaeon]|nr:hypothetical protein [Thermoplasmata archaeon]